MSTWQRIWWGDETPEEFAATYEGPYEFWLGPRGELHAKHPDRRIVMIIKPTDIVSIRSEDDPEGFRFAIEHVACSHGGNAIQCPDLPKMIAAARGSA